MPAAPTDEAQVLRQIGGHVAAIDFGGTNFDVLLLRDGELTRRFFPAGRPMDAKAVCALLAKSGVADLRELNWIAVTGGRHQFLPDAINGTPLVKVGELQAIGRGGLLASGLDQALVVSLGTGTAMVGARGEQVRHLGGTGVGGGTLLGLSRLLLGTADAATIDELARQGDPERIDLTVGDIVGGPVGMIPANATASHFGKASGIVAGPWVGDEVQAGREHVAAALMNMVGQATVRLALLAANANGYPSLVLIGHLADLDGIRKAAGMIGALFGGEIMVPANPGFAIALGALAEAAGRERGIGN
ncbi:MAG TPA: Fumble domain-containing protein [Dehalococcoidia bacterium]|nr:Fumble domain-containing protein [Dehalococcoidia bacterium]